MALISLDTSRFDVCVQQFGQITDGLLPPRQVFREDALLFLCEWGAGKRKRGAGDREDPAIKSRRRHSLLLGPDRDKTPCWRTRLHLRTTAFSGAFQYKVRASLGEVTRRCTGERYWRVR